MKRIFIFQIVGLLLFVACKKEESRPSNELENNPNLTAKATDYYPLEVGNYWIYESFEVDTLGNDIQSLGIDSVVVTSDTVIDGEKQFYIGSVNYPRTDVTAYQRHRDSSGCIVDQFGRITLSVNNFNDTIKDILNLTSGGDSLRYVCYKMEEYKGAVEVPAGVFSELLNCKGTVYTSFEHLKVDSNRTFNQLFQKDVGLVFQSYFYSNSVLTIERRLIRYHIKEA